MGIVKVGRGRGGGSTRVRNF